MNMCIRGFLANVFAEPGALKDLGIQIIFLAEVAPYICRLSQSPFCLEAISKPHLSPDCSVAALLKILTYSRVCCVFSSACALPSNLI